VTTTQGWRWVGESALLRSFDGAPSEANAAAHALALEIGALSAEEVADVVPGARTVLVRLHPGADPPRRLLAAFEQVPIARARANPPLVEIPVRYGGDDGPDLTDVARTARLDDDEVVQRHAAGEYTVAFVGFSPGFAYLLGLPDELAVPRLETPRTRVPAGSVAIGGRYTGVYPRATPGGWRVIGRTDAELFDAGRDPPANLAPGDRVRFIPT
jgi:KipI family sensor histidine kinase inhibitor